jgi:FlaA1/EpsC-like NDP-sugar epimerase
LLDSSEFALYNIERELREQAGRSGYRGRVVALLGSVQDQARMRLLLEAFEVETLYHAAAYKHVPLVEQNVVEGVRNNVLGTLALARAASAARVRNFVLISTDKAVRPTNVMGACKRVCEMIVQSMLGEGGTCSSIVRFGNVIGSSGSAVPLFREQIAAGGPVTVTDPDAQRYFMTIPEAAQLVLQASAIGSGGDVFVLDMGEPVRILDLARRMIHLAGKEVRDESNPDGDIEICFTGLRAGEKLREELLSDGNVGATGHPMIMRAVESCPSRLELERALDELHSACEEQDCERVREVFARVVPGFDLGYACVDAVAARLRERGEVTRPRLRVLPPAQSR